MTFCRSILRRWFVFNRKIERKKEKKLVRGSVNNLLTTTLQKLLLSAAGMTLLTQPLYSAVTRLANNTSVKYDSSKKTYTITTTDIKERNAFTAFSEFTLKSNEIANFNFTY